MGSAASSSTSKHERFDTPTNSLPHNGHVANRTDHQYERPPSPYPPRTRKAVAFNEADYKHVDEYVRKMPARLNFGTFKDLAAYLTAPVGWDDIAKVRAIFRWVTSVDVFSLQVDRQPPKNSPSEYFIRIQKNMGNHAHLMAGMCQIAEIPCIIVSGMNKSAAYEIGKKLDKKSMCAQWNIVYVGGNWRVIDAFWASACVVGKKSGEWALVDSGTDAEGEEDVNEGTTQHRINEFYFFPDPDQFIWTHFPNNSQLQLLTKPVSVDEFESHFYMRERFHVLGIITVPTTKISCNQETKDGEIDLCFGLARDKSVNYRFKYMVYRSRTADSLSRIDTFFDRFVLYQKQTDLLKFSLRFPIRGSFKVDIYGLDIEDGDVFDLCCTYIINCPQAKQNCLPLPDCPPLGWGPVAETESAGLTPLTHKQAEIVSKDGFVEIRLAKDRGLAFYQLLKHSVLDEATLSKYSVAELKPDEAVVHVRLPQKGEYALKLYAQDLNDQGPAQNILNYLINCVNTNSESKPFPNVSNGLLGDNPRVSKSYYAKAVSHPNGRLEAKNGQISVEFKADLEVELVCEMHTIDGRAAKEMRNVVTNTGQKWTFDLDMPVRGEYSLNVFAREKGLSGQIHCVHSYLIDSKGRKATGNSAAGDDNDGENTTVPTETLDTSEEQVSIPIPRGCKNVVAAIYRRNGYDPPDPGQIEYFSSDDMQMVTAKLPDYGEYMFNLYDRNHGENTVQNVAKYQINRKRPGVLYNNNISSIMADIKPIMSYTPVNMEDTSEEEAKQQARKNVKNAMDLKDARHLEEAIKNCIAVGFDENDPLLKKAKQQLEILKAKAELMEATHSRNTDSLNKAISRAKSANVNHELDVQIGLAVKLRDHLVAIERLRHTVLNMESKTVCEIKSYASPPDGVHQCMIATFLLLGHQLNEVKNWQQVQALMGKTGKESVMRKISNFDAQAVPLKRAQVAKKIVQPYDKKQIRDVSAGAATFYNWAVGMIEEVEAYGGAEQAGNLRLMK